MTAEKANSWLATCLGRASPTELFPWQRALLERFVKGDVPGTLDLPTGLGKTSVMAIWLVAHALGAPLPRRLIYVVDRRAVVDQATDVAEGLREIVLSTPDLGAALKLHGRELPISTLRGQFADNREWRNDPASIAIVVGTVDMIGSRLLFQGYGVSRKMRPVHAALLGADALIVMDEAHLSAPFLATLRELAHADWRAPHAPPLKVMAMSATTLAARDSFALDEPDRAHEAVQVRLRAVKRVLLRERIPAAGLADALAREALAIAGDGARRILVYCDKRKDAERVAQALRKSEGEVELIVGARRVREREQAREWLRSHGFLASAPATPTRPAFLVATSAGEVGVDVDAEHMVGDIVTWERMVQRLGRVNRRGAYDANVVLVPTDEEKGAGIRDAVIDLISSLAGIEGAPNASPEALLELRARTASEPKIRSLVEAASSPVPLRPALTLAHAEAWSMTSLREHPGRPDVAPWLRGWLPEEPPQTTIVWRAHMPTRWRGGRTTAAQIEAFFEAAPPHRTEELETESFAAAEWLMQRAKVMPKPSPFLADDDDPGALRGEDPVAIVLSRAGELRRTLSLDDLQGGEKAEIEDQIKDATLIMDGRIAGLGDNGLLEKTQASPPKVADGDGEDWLRDPKTGKSLDIVRVRRIQASVVRTADPLWKERFRLELDPIEKEDRWCLVVERPRGDASGDDDLAMGAWQELDEHEEQVRGAADALAQRLGLAPALGDLLRHAARWHDEGKRTPRWQSAFRARLDAVYAKTPGPIDQRRLAGYRHELGSVLAAERMPELQKMTEADRDLVLHLIAAHHGRARPTIGTQGCDESEVNLPTKREEIALRFARLQEQLGPWGLAWLELMLRTADQRASEALEEHEVDHG